MSDNHAHFSKNCDCPMWLQHTARCECYECIPEIGVTKLPANTHNPETGEELGVPKRMRHVGTLEKHMEAPIFAQLASEPHVVSTDSGKEGWSMAQFLADKTEKPYVWPTSEDTKEWLKTNGFYDGSPAPVLEPAAGATSVAVMREEDPWLGVPGGPLPLSEQDIFYPEPITTFQVMMGLLAVLLLIGCGIAWVVLT